MDKLDFVVESLLALNGTASRIVWGEIRVCRSPDMVTAR